MYGDARVCPICWGRSRCAYGDCYRKETPWWQEVLLGVVVGAGAIGALLFAMGLL